MNLKRVAVLGDSILKGVQADRDTKKYVISNNIDINSIESRFGLQVRNDSHFGATVEKGRRLFDRLVKRDFNYDYLIMDFGGNDCNHRWD